MDENDNQDNNQFDDMDDASRQLSNNMIMNEFDPESTNPENGSHIVENEQDLNHMMIDNDDENGINTVRDLTLNQNVQIGSSNLAFLSNVDGMNSVPQTPKRQQAAASAAENAHTASEELRLNQEAAVLASRVVQHACNQSMTPLQFGYLVRASLVSSEPPSSPISFDAAEENVLLSEHIFRTRMTSDFLNKEVQFALVNSVLTRICASEAPSTRLFAYLKELLMVGIVSSFSILKGINQKYAESEDGNHETFISEAVKDAFIKLLAQMLPWYNMATCKNVDEMKLECQEFLLALLLILKTFSSEFMTNQSHGTPSQLKALMDDRIIALARASGRRCHEPWMPIQIQATHVIDTTSAFIQSVGRNPSPEQSGALMTAKQWQAICLRLRDGLAAGVATPFTRKVIEAKNGQLSLTLIMEFVLKNTTPILGEGVTLALKEFWTKKESEQGDLETLRKIDAAALGLYMQSLAEQEATAHQNGATPADPAPASKPRHSFREQFRMCEMFVKQFGEAATIRCTSTEKWLSEWGGVSRLSRLLKDVLPVMIPELKCTYSCLMVATAVIAACAMCLGPNLVLEGIAQSNAIDLNPNDELYDLVTVFGSYAVDCLKDVASAEEVHPNHSFGLWLVRLGARAGGLLRLSKCNYGLIVRILRAWEVLNGGKPFTDSCLGRNGVELSPSAVALNSDNAAISGTKASSSLSSSTAVLVVDAADLVESELGLRLLCTEPVQ
uniref:Uncharacterized protein n=1 Tax=Timspurckia oligopyrenoides TaxID=708627 RepID=A0A7S0ZHB0_9RHOD